MRDSSTFRQAGWNEALSFTAAKLRDIQERYGRDAVAVYGGYFGGAVGIVNLAMLAAIGMTDIHAMNALKSVLGTAINGVATLVFILKRAVYWPQALVMIVGAVVGGYFGAHYAQKLPQNRVRGFVIVVGAGMTIYFFVKAY